MIKYENYIIEANSEGGYMVSEIKINNKNGEEYKANTCYPNTIKGCINKILNWEFGKTIKKNDYTLKEALEKLEEIHNKLFNFYEQNIKEEI